MTCWRLLRLYEKTLPFQHLLPEAIQRRVSRWDQVSHYWMNTTHKHIMYLKLSLLYSICRQKIERLIDEYEHKCKEFMSSATLNQFKELFPESVNSSALSARNKIMITLKLISNQWGDRTLEDLKSLINHLGFPTSHLHIMKFTEGCNAVHMLCPCHVVPELKSAVSAASDKLYKNGVLQVSVGEAVVLSLMNTYEGEHSDYIYVCTKN